MTTLNFPNHFKLDFTMRYLTLTTVAMLALFSSCKTSEKGGFSGTIIPINAEKKAVKLSSIIDVKSFVELSAADDAMPKNINQIVFGGGHLYVLDNETDFNEVYQFDAQTGRGLGKIGTQWDRDNGYESVLDICTSNSGELTLLSDAKQAFFNFSENGGLKSRLANGVYGDQLVRDKNDGYVVYNEFSETPVSKNYRLLFYYAQGNLTHRSQAYDRRLEGRGYAFAGFLRKAGSDIWYSPPFCDTVFSVQGKAVKPAYLLDFGKDGIPASLIKGKQVRADDYMNSGFLNEWFLRTGDFVQFEYQSQGKIRHGIFNERTGEFMDIGQAETDCLSKLLERGTIMPKNDREFVLVLRKFQLESLRRTGMVEQEALNRLCSGLGDGIEKAQNHIVVTLAFK